MARQYSELTEKLITFIGEQKIFFVGTAIADGRVNVSPKGMDSLRVVNKNRVVWLNLTGSGNETSAHIQENNRMTLMFCAFEGGPMILRLYGSAKVIHPRDCAWKKLYPLFAAHPGARQIFDLSIALVQTSCGMAVPCMEYRSDRDLLTKWTNKQDIEKYWEEKNQFSIDGESTNIMD